MAERHPGKSPAQRAALDEIGCGNFAPRMSPATRKALLVRGLIEPCGERIICQDRFGTVRVTEYQMPIPVHYQWCKYWSEISDCEDDGFAGEAEIWSEIDAAMIAERSKRDA